MQKVLANVPDELVWGSTIVGSVGAFALLTRLINIQPGERHSSDLLRCGKQLVRQALEFHQQAQQDVDVLFKLRHNGFAIAYMNAARAALPDSVLQRLTSIDVHETLASLEAHQQAYMKKMNKTCPAANPKGKVSTTSWIGI